MATTKTIQSVERAFSILEYLQQCGGGERSVKEIADALELNKSTAFGLINTLTTLGYLQQNADNQKYVLSLKLLSFSNTIKVQNSIIRTVHPYLEQISLKYGEIAHCGVAQGDSVIYVDKVESSRSLSINTQIGTKNYLHCTGVGKCILAYMPEDEQQHILAGPLKALTFNTIVDPRQLQAELRHIRADGYGFQIEMAYEVNRNGGRIVEVPITFGERQRGTSKMSSRIVFEALGLVTWWGLRDRIIAPIRRLVRRSPR